MWHFALDAHVLLVNALCLAEIFTAHTIFSQRKTEAQLQEGCYDRLSLTPLRLWKLSALSLRVCLWAPIYYGVVLHAFRTHILCIFVPVNTFTPDLSTLAQALWNISCWIFHVSCIWLISPVCILTHQMKAELWSGWFISLLENFSKLVFPPFARIFFFLSVTDSVCLSN